MARQILPALDLRTSEEKRGLSSSQRNLQAITGILQTLGKAEQQRRESQQLDRIATAIANGATSIEAINAIVKQQSQTGTGFQGILQKIGGAFQPSPGGVQRGVQESIIGQRLQQILTPKGEVPPGLEPTGASVSPTGKVTTRFGQPKEEQALFDQTKADKSLDRDIKILTNKDTKGNLKASAIQRAKARKRLRRNPSLQDIVPGKANYAENVEGKPRVKVGTFDKAFGKEAYTKALREAKDEGLAKGATETSVEADFNSWWDKQVAKEAEDTFIKFVPRSEFQDISETQDIEVPGPQPRSTPQDIRPGQAKEISDTRLQAAPDARLDSVWDELSTDQKKQILTQIDQNPENIETIITNVLARIQGAGY